MQHEQELGAAIPWDTAPIETPDEDGNFTILPEGVYPFTVTNFERGQFDGSLKMCACAKAVITCRIDAGELGAVDVKSNLHMNKKCVGILCSFFTCVGMRKHGDPLVPNWQGAVTRGGKCKVAPREYNGKTFNDIKAWLEPETNDAKPPIPF